MLGGRGVDFFVLIDYLVNAILIAIFVRAILSWFPVNRDNPIISIIFQITDPILAPVRSIMPGRGIIDLSPMVTIILIVIMREVLRGVLAG